MGSIMARFLKSHNLVVQPGELMCLLWAGREGRRTEGVYFLSTFRARSRQCFPWTQVGDTLLKLAQLPGNCRGAVMLSRTMQQQEFGQDNYLQSSILRPVAHWCWQAGRGWILDTADEEDFKLIIQCPCFFLVTNFECCCLGRYSPFSSVEDLMQAFELLGADFKTHLIIHGLNPAVKLLPEMSTPSDVSFSDIPAPCWPAKQSLRQLLATIYPSGIGLSKTGSRAPCVFQLFGTVVLPLDLSRESCRWHSDVIDLLPGKTIKAFDGATIRNSTGFGVRVGFVHNAAELRVQKNVKSAQFLEAQDNKLQGLMGLSRSGRVLQMPNPIQPSRSGSILDGPKGFKIGIGALMIVCAPGNLHYMYSLVCACQRSCIIVAL